MQTLIDNEEVRRALAGINPAQQSVCTKSANFSRAGYNGGFDSLFRESGPDRSISRSDVYAAFDKKFDEGVLTAFVWGFPTGGRGTAGARVIQNLMSIAADVALAARNGCTAQRWEALNSHRGINFATTTKFLYFARVSAEENPCLIFDARVRKFLECNRPREFRETLAGLDNIRGYGLPYSTYVSYLKEMSAASDALRCSADALEMYMFREAPGYRRPRHQ